MALTVNLEEILSRRILLADGAMGTMLYERGIFLNSCFDELNLSNPELVAGIHRAYVEAGVDLIETNSFGANEFKLARFGLADKVAEINRAAVEIAKRAAKSGVMVAGAIGPLGFPVTEHSRLPADGAENAFAVQARALAEAGADFLILETFSSTDELLIAIRAAALTGLAIIAQMTVNEHSETLYGERIDQAIARIAAEPAVTAVGLNCSVGPSDMLTSLELIRPVTQKPISVQPNAGLPRQVEDRTLYMCTPEYMAEYAKRFYEKGARIIGGCCGTTPNHIREIVRAVRSLDKAAHRRPKVSPAAPAPAAVAEKGVKPVPLAERSAFGAKIAAGLPVTTIELTPPKGVDLSATIGKARICAEHGVDAINIPDGPRASSRLSPMVTAIRIQQEAGIETILHFCCRDRNLIGMQSDLLGAAAIGLKNMLIITGDPPKLGDYPNATGVFDMDSIALTGVLHNLNRGLDIGGNPFAPPTAMTIGVGANPAAADLQREIDKFRQKVTAGAEYAITQPVFDAQMLFDFLDAIEDFRIPVIAGIWPFTSYKNAEFMANEVPGVVVPEQLLARMSTASTKEQARVLGIEIAREMIAKISERVAGFAVSAPFGNVKTALAVLSKIDINET
jgi:methionine synthase I (cobalamin-dependent)/5,10-methylenetetrahydrofolate reductase